MRMAFGASRDFCATDAIVPFAIVTVAEGSTRSPSNTRTSLETTSEGSCRAPVSGGLTTMSIVVSHESNADHPVRIAASPSNNDEV